MFSFSPAYNCKNTNRQIWNNRFLLSITYNTMRCIQIMAIWHTNKTWFFNIGLFKYEQILIISLANYFKVLITVILRMFYHQKQQLLCFYAQYIPNNRVIFWVMASERRIINIQEMQKFTQASSPQHRGQVIYLAHNLFLQLMRTDRRREKSPKTTTNRQTENTRDIYDESNGTWPLLTEIVEGELIKSVQTRSLPSASSSLLVDTEIGEEESEMIELSNVMIFVTVT